MAINVSIRANINKARKKLKLLGRKLDSETVGTLIGLGFVDWIDKNFASEGVLGGKPWKELSANTVAGRKGGSSKILQDIGDLKRSFQQNLNRVGGGLSVDIGTPVPHAKFHEKGTKPFVIRPKNKKALKFQTAGGFIIRKSVKHPGLPKRKMLPTKKVGKQLAEKILLAYLEKITQEVERSVA